MPEPLDKVRIVRALVTALEAEAAALLATATATIEGATHEEARPENDKDTRALEASYLARGQAQRVEDMNETLTRLRFLELPAYGPGEAIGPAALVELDIDDAGKKLLFLVPVGGGRLLEVEGIQLRVVTIASPIGQALLGKVAGDDFELNIAGRRREYIIESVQ